MLFCAVQPSLISCCCFFSPIMLCFAAAAWICSCVLCPDDNVCLHIHLLFEPPFFSLFFILSLHPPSHYFLFSTLQTYCLSPLTKYILLFLFTVLIAHLFIPLLLSFFHVPPLLLPTFLSHFPQFYPNFYFLCHSLSALSLASSFILHALCRHRWSWAEEAEGTSVTVFDIIHHCWLILDVGPNSGNRSLSQCPTSTIWLWMRIILDPDGCRTSGGNICFHFTYEEITFYKPFRKLCRKNTFSQSPE